MPVEFELSQNWPNPFNPSTSISYYLPESGIVKVSVYNIMGELVHSQQPEFVPQGQHIIKFEGSHLPSGVYILNVTFAGQRKSIKMLLLK
ncbi:MAG: T9SS type A sorting domain-containing protein [Ignavibacteriales bacterium]|nr:T9SS type A sorting domain-containing protein [Ignavibacteriales bacterium]